jgi:hypothetical protein
MIFPISASQIARITGMNHCAQPWQVFKLICLSVEVLKYVQKFLDTTFQSEVELNFPPLECAVDSIKCK